MTAYELKKALTVLNIINFTEEESSRLIKTILNGCVSKLILLKTTSYKIKDEYIGLLIVSKRKLVKNR